MNCGMVCLKYLLFAFNFVFWIAGIGVLGVGIWSRIEAKDYDSFLGSGGLTSAANIMIAAGVFVMIVGFVGCCGALKENKWLLTTYFVLLLLIFILEIAAGIFAYVKRDQVTKAVTKNIKKIVTDNYGKSSKADKAFTTAVDKLQTKMKCCGVNGPGDWNNTAWSKIPANKPYVTPKSCCKVQNSANCQKLVADSYSKGCVDAMKSYVKSHIAIIGGIGVGIAFIQILGMVFAMCLCRAVSYEKI
eukprot:Seg130.2 transcript_id=Seg130.2/GoldUCD/mRNA.D3Y31 product="CD151 antigen" protein_id=Seg130.2/GoldUCD/D3Y31